VRQRDREIEVRVRFVPAARNVSKRDAKELIEVLSEKHFEPTGT